MKPMIKIRTIAPPYEPPRCFFEAFEYTEQTDAEHCIQKLTQNHLLPLSPSGQIRARSCLVASYPKFIRPLQGIPFLTAGLLLANPIKSIWSAVTGRTLNEHEHVDKQIFEILDLAERAQVPMDVNVNRVADLASNASPNISYKENS
jgi:hypothetical protein